MPRDTKRDAILFESEDEWVAFQRKRDAEHPPSGKMSMLIPVYILYLFFFVVQPKVTSPQFAASAMKFTNDGLG